MGQRGGNHYGKGQETGVKVTGSRSRRYGKWDIQTPCSPPPPTFLIGHLSTNVLVKKALPQSIFCIFIPKFSQENELQKVGLQKVSQVCVHRGSSLPVDGNWSKPAVLYEDICATVMW